MTEDEEELIRIRALNKSLDKFLEVINEAESMDDIRWLNQKVDNLREELALLNRDQDWTRAKKVAVLEELLDTRRQITQAEKQAKLILGL